MRAPPSPHELKRQTTAGEVRSDVIGAVRRNGAALYYATEEQRADRDIVLVALENHGTALQFAAAALRADKACVLTAVREDGAALRTRMNNIE